MNLVHSQEEQDYLVSIFGEGARPYLLRPITGRELYGARRWFLLKCRRSLCFLWSCRCRAFATCRTYRNQTHHKE